MLTGAAALYAASTYVPVFGSVRDESDRWGYNPAPALLLGFVVAIVTWAFLIGLDVLARRRRPNGASRRLANEMLLLFASLPLLGDLVFWVFQ